MYHQIYRMSRDGWKLSRISSFLKIDRRTVKKYLGMTEDEYFDYIKSHRKRKKELSYYEGFVKAKLDRFPETSAAQMHDWLKEHYDNFPKVSSKSVYNFVMWVRQQHNIPKETKARDYSIVDELPYGQQAQVDFGEFNMRDGRGKRIKVYFFIMSLSRSRFKYVMFSLRPFTTALSIIAHQKAFEYFGGIPKEIVYDQDSVFIHDENKGDILFTKQFRAYCNSMPFNIYFCRKSDPESKGKIENVVKYVKQNFLYNRPFVDIETLNQEALNWLSRTANGMPHGFTGKKPADELLIEKDYLLKNMTYVFETEPDHYKVRKDNVISFKGNFYSLPLGTYKNKDTRIELIKEDDKLIIKDLSGNLLCTHIRSYERGKIISNTDHKRDKSKKVDALILDVAMIFPDYDKALIYLERIRKAKKRYARDQVEMIKKVIKKAAPEIIRQALDYCLENNINSSNDFAAVMDKYNSEKSNNDVLKIPPKLVSSNISKKIEEVIPNTSNIIFYEQIMKN